MNASDHELLQAKYRMRIYQDGEYRHFDVGVYIIPGMPNVRKNPFSTDFYHLFQSTDKKIDLGTNLLIFSYSV